MQKEDMTLWISKITKLLFLIKVYTFVHSRGENEFRKIPKNIKRSMQFNAPKVVGGASEHVCLIIIEEQQMNSSIRWIVAICRGPKGQKTEGKREQEKRKQESRRSIECVFLWLKNCPWWLWKGGIILSSKQTFGYSWPTERLGELKEDTVRMGLNIKVTVRSAGLGHESSTTEPQRSQRGAMGPAGTSCRLCRQPFERLQEEELQASVKRMTWWGAHLSPWGNTIAKHSIDE